MDKNGYNKNGEVPGLGMMVPLEFRRGMLLKLKQSGVRKGYDAHSGKVFAFYRIAQLEVTEC